MAEVGMKLNSATIADDVVRRVIRTNPAFLDTVQGKRDYTR
jgi:hypothetical protein